MAKEQPVEAKPDDNWKAESDARTLIEAEHIKQDPERYAAAKVFLGKQRKAIMSLDDLEEETNQRMKELNDDSDED